jgi:redox-sensitive bicupin YhaK (pirin superfamily)
MTDAIERVIEPRARDLGGLTVARVLPTMGCRAVGPVVFLDHLPRVPIAPGVGFDVLPHPHIGLSTVSYLFEGEILHRDSLGSVATIEPGAIAVMTANRGIVHSERAPDRFRREGGTLHQLQFWVAVPAADEDLDPHFEHHAADAIPELAVDGGRARVLLGSALGATSPARTRSEPVMIDLRLDAGARFVVPREIEDVALYVIDGSIACGTRRFGRHTLVVRTPGAALALDVLEPSHLFLLGGPRLEGQLTRDPRKLEWNFCATTQDRIEAAKRRWRRRELPTIPGDDRERVPLPGEENE